MNCARRGSQSPDRAKFCLEYGAAFATRCAGCGTELPPAAKFCLECGAKVVERATPSSAPRDYTPRHLAEKILQSKSALEGERKQVTVLFADVKGSMDLAEQVDPEQWHKIMDRFFLILSEGVLGMGNIVVVFALNLRRQVVPVFRCEALRFALR